LLAKGMINKKSVIIILIIIIITAGLLVWRFASPQSFNNALDKVVNIFSADKGSGNGEGTNAQPSAGNSSVGGKGAGSGAGGAGGTASSKESESYSFGEVFPQYYCTDESRTVESCEGAQHPVCGWYDPEQANCGDENCVHGFASECEACADENVVYWTDGDCPLHEYSF
jgi:hypothetical protein